MVLPIRDKDDKVLRGKAKPVPASLFGTPELKKMIDDMAETMDAEKDGVAIAAPQVGIPYRLFLVRFDRVLPPVKKGELERAAELGVFINPELVKLSKKNVEMDEGCLSVRNIYGKTKRKERATVRAFDANGKKFERGGGKILAQAFQHEIEHLNGILFTDHATDLITLDQQKESEEASNTDE
jgi:peptide deformylase